MTRKSAQSLIEQLDDLLDIERRALLAGDLDQITRLIEQKEALIDGLSGLDTQSEEPMLGLQEKLMRNQVLLDGALQGIRRASSRMAAVRHVRRTLETYDEDGRKRTIEGQIVHKVEKRA
ncbi:MAG: flagellar protein FlgN [Pseudomonadota bacterium]